MRATGIRRVTAWTLALAVILGAAPVFATGQAYPGLQVDWLWQVQDLLRQAAVNGDRWATDREQIERRVDGIGYRLQQAVVAEYRSDLPRADAYLTQALELLRDGVRRGYFQLPEVKRVLALVQRYRDVIKV